MRCFGVVGERSGRHPRWAILGDVRLIERVLRYAERGTPLDGKVAYVEVPGWLDDWFARSQTAADHQYVGMTEQEARSITAHNGIRQIRTIDVPLIGVVTADRGPHRLNLLVADSRVLCAAFF